MLDYSGLAEVMERTKGQLRGYQLEAVAKGIRSKRLLLDMLVGSGKTWPALTILFALRPRKVLILCSRNSLAAWLGEIRERFPEYADPEEFIMIKAQGMSTAKRKALWHLPRTYYISTLQTFNLDQKDALSNRFDAVIIDEVHKVPKHTTKTYKALKQGIKDIPVMLFLTGTWVKMHAGTGWRQLHLMNPRLFSSYWKFIGRFCNVIDGAFGKEILGPKNTELWRHVIHENVFRFHDKSAVPASSRKILWIDRDPEQLKIYEDLTRDMMSMLDSGTLLISKVSIATFTKHRQLLNCPRQLDSSLGMGAAFTGLLEHLQDEDFRDDPEEQHFVLFSPFRRSIPIFEEALQKLGYKTFLFVGGTDGEEIMRRSLEFRALKGTKSVALCTIDFAESFHLGTATRSHFMGALTYKDKMVQAEGRLARADSDLSKTILHRYWMYNQTLDEELLYTVRQRAGDVRKLFKDVDDAMKYLHA